MAHARVALPAQQQQPHLRLRARDQLARQRSASRA